MMPDPDMVIQRAVLAEAVHRGDVPALLLGHLVYRSVDPWVVSLVLRTSAGPARWDLDRGLISSGRHRTSGLGSALVAPGPCSGSLTRVSLASAAGWAEILLSRCDVDSFLAASERLVPVGSEALRIRWQSELSRLILPRAGSPDTHRRRAPDAD